MKPLFLGGHPALDFLNTAYFDAGAPAERIGDGRAYADWLEAAGLVDDARSLFRRLGPAGLDRAAGEARVFRDWSRKWVERWRTNPGGDYRREIAALNELLARGPAVKEVNSDFSVSQRMLLENPRQLASLVADAFAKLMSEEDAALIKCCAASDCSLVFLDRTKAGRRKFCSASVCGNRAKVAAFRRRERKKTP